MTALLPYAQTIITLCTEKHLKLATAESCTGGLLMGTLTEIIGASAVMDRGFITYSNDAKKKVLGVPATFLQEHGAVSEPVARAMAEGALWASPVDLAVSITGIAGPGNSEHKPEGLVHIACALRKGKTWHEIHRFGPIGRFQVRTGSVKAALQLIIASIRHIN